MSPNKTAIIFAFCCCWLCFAIKGQASVPTANLSIFPPSEKEVEIYNIQQLNSKGLDFCAIPYRKGIVFTSSRHIDDKTGMRNLFNKNYFDLYYSERNGAGNYSDPRRLKGNINGKLHDGTATFNEAGNRMYFTRNNEKTKGKIALKIYSAEMIEGNWINVEELPFNSQKFSNCHPSLSKDGKQLFFASDRPGGYGGMDVYVSTLKNNKWSKPENLGVNVNGEGNELFPFVDDYGDLYVSSDGFGTTGRLDIFVCDRDGKRFKHKRNLGEPFNTRSDDFGFFIDKNKEHGFLSSNRLGGNGNDDVYGWRLVDKKEEVGVSRKFIVIDELTGEKIEEAEVVVEQELEDWNRTVLKSATKGEYDYAVKNSEEYFIKIEKEGFIGFAKVWNKKEMMDKEVHTLYLKKRTFSLLSGKVEGQIYHDAMEGVEIELLNECDGRKQKAKTDADGIFGFTIMCGCEYVILAKKDGFLTANKKVSIKENSCKDTQLVEKKLELRPAPNSSFPRASAFDD